jgi:hypothetical protein
LLGVLASVDAALRPFAATVGDGGHDAQKGNEAVAVPTVPAATTVALDIGVPVSREEDDTTPSKHGDPKVLDDQVVEQQERGTMTQHPSSSSKRPKRQKKEAPAAIDEFDAVFAGVDNQQDGDVVAASTSAKKIDKAKKSRRKDDEGEDGSFFESSDRKAEGSRQPAADEFGDIFGSLETKRKKVSSSKIRKKKRGDEFDDIFGSLT